MAVRLLAIQADDVWTGATDEPAIINRDGMIAQRFHYWRGQSGKRYLHTVYSLLECPEVPRANYILVRRMPSGRCKPVRVGQTREGATSLNLAHLRHEAAALGADEVHIHVLSDSSPARDEVEQDIVAAQTADAGPMAGEMIPALNPAAVMPAIDHLVPAAISQM